jgi:hypothetical protein
MAEKQKPNGSESTRRSGGIAETVVAVAAIGVGAAEMAEAVPGAEGAEKRPRKK